MTASIASATARIRTSIGSGIRCPQDLDVPVRVNSIPRTKKPIIIPALKPNAKEE